MQFRDLNRDPQIQQLQQSRCSDSLLGLPTLAQLEVAKLSRDQPEAQGRSLLTRHPFAIARVTAGPHRREWGQ